MVPGVSILGAGVPLYIVTIGKLVAYSNIKAYSMVHIHILWIVGIKSVRIKCIRIVKEFWATAGYICSSLKRSRAKL